MVNDKYCKQCICGIISIFKKFEQERTQSKKVPKVSLNCNYIF